MGRSYAPGGTLILSSYTSFDPAFTVYSQKYQEYQEPPKIFEILATPQNISLTVRNDPKMHRNDP